MRIAVVGCGEQGAAVLLPCALAATTASVTAVCDSSPGRAQAVAQRWRVPAWFDSIEALLEAKVADAVVLAATPQAHAEIIRCALPNGIAVFVEKPAAASLSELQTLVALARRHRLTTQVGHNLRFAPAIMRLQSLLASKEFGAPLLFSARYFASWPKGDRWSLENPLRAFLLTHFIHLIDLTLHLCGPLVRVVPRAQWNRDTGLIVVQADLTCESGTEVHLESTNAAPRFQIELTALGSMGVVARVAGLRRFEVTSANDRERSSIWEPGQFESGNVLAGYKGEIQAFVDAVREHREGMPSLETAVPVYEVLRAIEQEASSFDGGRRMP